MTIRINPAPPRFIRAWGLTDGVWIYFKWASGEVVYHSSN